MKPFRCAVVLLIMALSGAGCTACFDKNEAATNACKGSAHNKACQSCCGMNGSSVSSYWPGSSGCTCFKR